MKNMYFLNNSIANDYLEKNGVKFTDGIYRLDDVVVKRYNEEKSKTVYEDFSSDMLLQFKDIDIERFYFIKALVYTGFFNIHSTISEYVNGVDLYEKSLAFYRIDDVISAIENLEKSIKKLSDFGIYANDVNYGNVIFDGVNLSIIDTAEYYYGDVDQSMVYEDNMMYIMNAIFSNLFYVFYKNRFDTIRKVHKYFNIRGSEFEYFCKKEYLMNPVDTLIGIRKFMEEDFGIQLNTFGDCHQYIDEVITDDFKNKIRVIKK